MKKILKIFLTSCIFMLCLGSISYAEVASNWVPAGVFSDFEGDISDFVTVANEAIVPDTVDGIFEGSGKALRFTHKLGTSTASASYIKPLDKNITFDAKKDYVYSFDFKTNTTDGHRFFDCYDGAGTRTNIIQILVADKVLYLRDDWNDHIAELSLNEPHSIRFIVDGETRRLTEILVDGETKDFVPSHFKAFPETVSAIGIRQNTWQNKLYSYYDNFCFMAAGDTENNVFYKIGENDDASAFGDNSLITVRAAVKSESAGDADMYLAVYDGSTLLDVIPYSFEMKKGMNYPSGTVSIDSNKKHLKVFIWDGELSPLLPVDTIRGNFSLMEYKSRIKAALPQRESVPSKSDIELILSKATDNGSFSNIKYTALSSDFCYMHCEYLLKLALALSNEGYSWGDIDKAAASSVLNKGVEYWIGFDTKSFTFENWYYENITVPEYIGKILTLADGGGILNNEILKNLADYMKVKADEIDAVSKIDTGSNILQMQRNKSYYAIYTEDTDMLFDCFDRIGKEMRLADDMTEPGDEWRETHWQTSVTIPGLPVTRPGIQSDYSTLFHGPQLYSGTYGLTFLNGVTQIMSDANGLGLFDDSNIENIIDQLLEHYAYIGRGTTLDYNTIGRTIATKGSSTTSGRFTEVYTIAQSLASLNLGYRQAELEALAASDDAGVPAVTGHRYFFKADYSAHTKADYLFTLKATSKRTIASEALSYTNLKGRSLGDGVSLIYRTGNEYDDIFAAWDWYKLPGTTAEVKPFDVISSETHSYESTSSDRVGGVSNGINGVTAQELIRGDLNAKKAWFMFDEGVVALGTDVTLNNDNTLYTTINQCMSSGDVIYMTKSGAGTLPFGSNETKIENPRWILNDGIGYIIGADSAVYAENKLRTGDRNVITWDGAASRPATPKEVNKNVFTLWFDHSKDSSQSYEYIILPGADETKLNSLISSPKYTVVSNNSSVQAVESVATGEYQTVMWEGATVNFADIDIIADSSCIIFVKTEGDGVRIYAARLGGSDADVLVTVKKGGQTVAEKLVTLPSDGSTIEVK